MSGGGSSWSAAGYRGVAQALARRMAIACDRTKPRKDGILVEVHDWHALMALADEVKQLVADERTATIGQQDGGK